MTVNEAAVIFALDMIRRGGVQEWLNPEFREQVAIAANELAAAMAGTGMALPDSFKVGPGTAKTIKSSAGDAAITLASLANGSARQAATLDMGANWARRWRLDCDFELAATPTAGNVVSLHGSWNGATGAGGGNTSGSDAAYSGYSSNLASSLNHLEYLGDHVCTVQTTSTVQKSRQGLIIVPKARYLNLVVYNQSGAAFHSSDSNCVITLTPLEDTVID